ncbi:MULTISPECIES: hypothetical protein [unclassified Bartonella]
MKFTESSSIEFLKAHPLNKLIKNASSPLTSNLFPLPPHTLPFSPNSPHSNDAFHTPTFTPPLALSSPQPRHNRHVLEQTHILNFTVPRFYDFANSQKTGNFR